MASSYVWVKVGVAVTLHSGVAIHCLKWRMGEKCGFGVGATMVAPEEGSTKIVEIPRLTEADYQLLVYVYFYVLQFRGQRRVVVVILMNIWVHSEGGYLSIS